MRSLRAATSRSLRRSISFQLVTQVGDALFDQPAVDFQLLFARPAHADAHLEPRQVIPHLLQPRQRVLQLGQLDRQSGLEGLRPAGKNVQNQLAAIKHLDAGGLLQVARLRRSEIVVEQDHVGIRRSGQLLQFVDLALAQIRRHVGRLAALGKLAHHARTGRGRQALAAPRAGLRAACDREAELLRESPPRWRRVSMRFISFTVGWFLAGCGF